jgi:choline dehydrogenase
MRDASPDKMRAHFKKLERNNYLKNGTAGHGFDGFLEVGIGDGSQYLNSPQSVEVLSAMVEELGKDPKDLKSLLTADANYLDPRRDFTEGLWALPFHVNQTWGRYSVRSRILDTVRGKFPLHLQLNSLATRVLFEPAAQGKKPRAIGVEFLEGKSVYKGDPRYEPKKKGTLRQVFATKEVIISGGAFNTPQILQLSGIGDAAELKKHNISAVVNLPGVGYNMQDNQEIAIVGLAAQNFTTVLPDGATVPPCTFGAPGDPCYDLWLKQQGPYAQAGPNSNIFLLRTTHSPDRERDITIFAGPFAFRGFWPATPNQTWYEPPNTWGMHIVKMHPHNRRGYVKIRSADPTDPPEINFRLFTEGALTDIGAMSEAVAWGRRAFRRVKGSAAPVKITHPPCPEDLNANGSCSDPNADEEWIRSETFGHHVTSTCPIGADDDDMAVLDSKFRVRGVDGLRVVDASVFPRIPGSFPVVATYIIGQKASDTILNDPK